jgi:hypothetical protein
MLSLQLHQLPHYLIKNQNHLKQPQIKKLKQHPSQTKKRNELALNKQTKKCMNQCVFTPQFPKKIINNMQVNLCSTLTKNQYMHNSNQTLISNSYLDKKIKENAIYHKTNIISPNRYPTITTTQKQTYYKISKSPTSTV